LDERSESDESTTTSINDTSNNNNDDNSNIDNNMLDNISLEYDNTDETHSAVFNITTDDDSNSIDIPNINDSANNNDLLDDDDTSNNDDSEEESNGNMNNNNNDDSCIPWIYTADNSRQSARIDGQPPPVNFNVIMISSAEPSYERESPLLSNKSTFFAAVYNGNNDSSNAINLSSFAEQYKGGIYLFQSIV